MNFLSILKRNFEVNFLDIFYDLKNYGITLEEKNFKNIDKNLIEIFLKFYDKNIIFRYKKAENKNRFYDKIIKKIEDLLKKKFKLQNIKDYKSKISDLMNIF